MPPIEFQKSVGTSQAPAVAGDFADSNPRASVNAGPGALVAGEGGLTIGLFAWITFDSNGQPATAVNNGDGAPDGFVHREQQGIITDYLAGAGMLIPEGVNCTVHNEGSFWAKNESGGAVAYGDAVYVSGATGQVVASGDSNAVDSGWTFASAAEDGELVKVTTHRTVA